MKINRVGCEQFAGICDREIRLKDGLNLIIGANESGKSTMADLIYHLLFKETKLDKRSDGDFIERYFPKKVSGPQGDVIDGVLEFETENGTYKIKKEWELGEGSCRLTLPDGTSIKGAESVSKVLASELTHRAGVYNEIVFATQKRQQLAVESIMKALSRKADSFAETRTDLASALSGAALETGGVSIEKLESVLSERLELLSSHWDMNADLPEGGAKRGIQNVWKVKVGEILDAYYAMELVRKAAVDTENAEKAVETEKELIAEIAKQKQSVEEKKQEFQDFRGIIGRMTLLQKSVKEQSLKLTDYRDVLEKWPGIRAQIETAKNLKAEQELAAAHDLYRKVCEVRENYETIKNEFGKMQAIDPSDVKVLRNAISKKQKAEGKIAGLDLAAKIRKLGDADIEIRSAASGEKLAFSEEFIITEAVDILIPGIMEMQLAPRGVDVEALRAELLVLSETIQSIYQKYDVHSPEELQEKAEDYTEAEGRLKAAELRLQTALGERSWEEIEAAGAAIPDGKYDSVLIQKKIRDLCGMRSIDAFIGGSEQTIKIYENRFETEEKLVQLIREAEADIEKSRTLLDSMDEVPEEYAGIRDPEQYDAELTKRIRDLEAQMTAHRDRQSEAERILGDKSSEDFYEELGICEEKLAAKKQEFAHWNHIYSVFMSLKGEAFGNPVEGIEKKFREYLSLITDGGLDITSIDEKLSVKLASGTHALTFDILSEGTKDTISLAFRLAFLEELFPEGNGLAVFDDPFTDMDPERMERACRLVTKFAERNQVIFITCDDKYVKYFDGNNIHID